MRIVSATTAAMARLAAHPPMELSREAKVRLAYLDWHRLHGDNISRTCRRFGISRTTFYRWQGRYRPDALAVLEDRSSCPHRRQQPTWTLAQLGVVRALRERYPRWGKDKLVVLLRRDGVVLSTAMVGRILAHLKRRGQLREPTRGISARTRATRRPYAVRKPKEYAVVDPGDLVQVDTLDVRPWPGRIYKQFTARDVVARWDVLGLHEKATAGTAASFLDRVLARMPFPVRGIQVDGGSEFMADFEESCQRHGLRLFVLPPRSPKLNGCVERAQRTHTEEFYEVTDADPRMPALRAELAAWEQTYNTVRPHQALGYLTPLEYVTAWHANQARKEAV
jgi:putative transposase